MTALCASSGPVDAVGRLWCAVAQAFVWVPVGAKWSDIADAEEVELDDVLLGTSPTATWRTVRERVSGHQVSAVRLSPVTGAPCDWRPASGASGWRPLLVSDTCTSFEQGTAVSGAVADSLLEELLPMPEWEHF